MPNRRSAFAENTLPGLSGISRQRTRAELLEAAGQVFAEKGFDRATGKEICERAGANIAAINYYFGGIDRLYAAVLEEANRRLAPVEAISAAVAAKKDARARLQAIIELLVSRLLGPSSSSWAFRVLSREMVAPSAAIEPLLKKQAVPRARLVRAIVAELMGLPADHPAVSLGCINVLAPLLLLFIADRGNLKRLFPSLSLSGNDVESLCAHMVQFAMSGLAEVARRA
jgi:AcrR family transcriptional regulator